MPAVVPAVVDRSRSLVVADAEEEWGRRTYSSHCIALDFRSAPPSLEDADYHYYYYYIPAAVATE